MLLRDRGVESGICRAWPAQQCCLRANTLRQHICLTAARYTHKLCIQTHEPCCCSLYLIGYRGACTTQETQHDLIALCSNFAVVTRSLGLWGGICLPTMLLWMGPSEVFPRIPVTSLSVSKGHPAWLLLSPIDRSTVNLPTLSPSSIPIQYPFNIHIGTGLGRDSPNTAEATARERGNFMMWLIGP
jgi:hypothetical protein